MAQASRRMETRMRATHVRHAEYALVAGTDNGLSFGYHCISETVKP